MSGRAVRAAAWVVLAACVAGPAAADECPELAADKCSQVYRVHGDDAVGLDILILPDGFTEAELTRYRRAVQCLVRKLVTMPPFAEYACHINVYRMDLTTSESGIPVNKLCHDRECPQQAAPEAFAACDESEIVQTPLVEGAPSCARRGLETHTCYYTHDCRFLGPSADGYAAIHVSSQCTASLLADGAIDATLVLANSGTHSGMRKRTPNVALASLSDAADPSHAWHLPIHELAHALFDLIDEYGGDGNTGEPYVSGLNVVSASEVANGSDFAWKEQCGEACRQYCTYDECPDGVTCRNDRPCCRPGTGREPGDPEVGLFEGAYYHQCAYYRASEKCLMQDTAFPFCPGCVAGVTDALARRGFTPCGLP